jgi:hypothetical protein
MSSNFSSVSTRHLYFCFLSIKSPTDLSLLTKLLIMNSCVNIIKPDMLDWGETVDLFRKGYLFDFRPGHKLS